MRWDDIPAWDAPNEMTNTVTDPENNYTINYFNVATDAVEGWDPKNYGLPFTERLRRGDRFLSRRSYEAGKSNTDPARSEYVRYERDGGNSIIAADRRNVRQAASETVHHRDGETYILSESSDFDGFGHYRTTRTSGDVSVATDRTVTTMYNETRGSYPGSTPLTFPAKWILGTFSYTKVTENGETYRTDYAFDETTGFLNRRRRRKDTTADAAAGTHDVIEVFTPDQRGNVMLEEYYGGDRHGTGAGDDHVVPADDLATLTLPAKADRVAAIRTIHVQPDENGFHSYSEYLDQYDDPLPFKLEDYTIDMNTGLPSRSRDVSTLETLYGYDWAARPTFVRSPGRATTFYTYTRARHETGFDTRAAVKVEQKDKATESIVRTRVRYEFDDLGRLTDEWQTMPAGTESQRRIVYDKLGRRHKVSELSDIAVFTTTTFDAFGRPGKVTAPDLSAVDFTYAGVGERTQSSNVATSATAEQSISKVERYDGFGRLVQVIEKSGPTTASTPVGSDVKTEYRYDAGNRLRRVTMGEGGQGKPSQERLFDYDGRGFLRWESHPESGLTSYTYDARGKLLRKTVGAADSLFDVKYEYDRGERLTLVKGRDPNTGAFRLLKEFQYASDNLPNLDWKKGKLILAQRYNYAGELEPVYTVSHYYYYDDPAGRRVRRDTSIWKEGAAAPLKSIYYGVTYNDLDRVESIDYPMCTGCGAPPVDPLREDQHVYSYGRLSRIEGIAGSSANPITYWSNGMRRAMRHQNGIEDGQEVGTMARPTEISFRTYDRCVRPSFISQPKGGAGTTLLSVSMAGTQDFRYEWRNVSTGELVSTAREFTVTSPTTTTSYRVTVTNACGIETSGTAIVTPSGCVQPSTGSVVPVRQPDGSWVLRPHPTSRPNPTYAWRLLGNSAVIGTGETYAVTALTATTTYSLTISDACGSVTSNVTITVPLPITKTALNATWNGTAIVVSWPAVTGAVDYVVERRAGAEWSPVGTVATPPFTDTNIQPSRSYAYRVYARGNGMGTHSELSNSDVATTKTYAAVTVHAPITSAAFDDLLDAVNKVRGAAGWPAVGWSNILTPTDALPSPGKLVTARHIIACRARMSEALQAVGARPRLYDHADPTSQMITAATLNEVLEQAQ